MKTSGPNPDGACALADLFAAAGRELGAFTKAVSELYGAEQACLATEDWLVELETSNELAGLTPSAWRCITLAASARLATRLNANSTDTKVSAIPSSNCVT